MVGEIGDEEGKMRGSVLLGKLQVIRQQKCNLTNDRQSWSYIAAYRDLLEIR